MNKAVLGLVICFIAGNGQAAVFQNPGSKSCHEAQSNLVPKNHEFSANGLKFGMFRNEVRKIVPDEHDFRLGGLGKSQGWVFKYDDNRLSSMRTVDKAENIYSALDIYIKKYGKPCVFGRKMQIEDNLKLDVFEARWFLNGAVITLVSHVSSDDGLVTIQSQAAYDKGEQVSKQDAPKS